MITIIKDYMVEKSKYRSSGNTVRNILADLVLTSLSNLCDGKEHKVGPLNDVKNTLHDRN